MKRNLIVLSGILIVIISSLFLPVMSFTQKIDSTATQENITQFDRSGVLFAVVILLFMLLRWKWRGVIWIVLGVAGAFWVPTSAYAIYLVGQHLVIALGEGGTREGLTYQIGLYITVIGYTVVAAGGYWDILQKRAQQAIRPVATT